MDDKDYREYQRELASITENVRELYTSIDIDTKKKELAELEALTLKEDFWKDKEKFAEVNQNISRLKRKIEPWNELLASVGETTELMEMAMSEQDEELLREICDNIDDIKNKFEETETKELLSDDEDINNAYISIHPGAGGTESQDWASMLFRMYMRWAEKNRYSIDVLDYTPGEEAGIKSATLFLKGDYAYGFMKGEMGIHRLVRISPFDANKRRHTSFASVEVVPDVPEDIEMDINESELRVDTYRASGAGGQHVNTTDSAVRITHIPTGIVVQCQNERSQHKNKAFAMKMLKARLHEYQKAQQDEKRQELMSEKKDISWGNQIRSYVFQPYTLVKDHRTGEETGSVDYVFDGDISRFIFAYLKNLKKVT